MMIRIVSMTYVALCAALVFGLYHVKNETLKLEGQRRDLGRNIERTQDEIKLLQAEWAMRTAPDFLARLAADHLSALRPTDPSQLGTIAGTPRRAPDEGPGEDSIARLLTQYDQGAWRLGGARYNKLRPTL
jgi:hypothetical protein